MEVSQGITQGTRLRGRAPKFGKFGIEEGVLKPSEGVRGHTNSECSETDSEALWRYRCANSHSYLQWNP